MSTPLPRVHLAQRKKMRKERNFNEEKGEKMKDLIRYSLYLFFLKKKDILFN